MKIDVDTLEDVPAGLNLPTAVLDGNNIYLVSGYDDAIGWSDAVYRYDIDGDTWSTETEGSDPLEAIPTPRTESCNTGLIDGFDKFCVIGGAEGTGFTYDGPSDAVECYDPAANSWSSLDPLPTAVTGQYCAVHDGIIYVTGGYTGSVFNTALWWLDTQNTGDGWQTATAAAVRPVQSFNGRGRSPAIPISAAANTALRSSSAPRINPHISAWIRKAGRRWRRTPTAFIRAFWKTAPITR
ncbi:MAG: hypothetical protein M5R36_18470 [Deltaproteobacteria bacterium]|nr:hypothetical protein [Deltaproteobacteria bacterium]